MSGEEKKITKEDIYKAIKDLYQHIDKIKEAIKEIKIEPKIGITSRAELIQHLKECEKCRKAVWKEVFKEGKYGGGKEEGGGEKGGKEEEPTIKITF